MEFGQPMSRAPALNGITVLDFSSVGPVPRCSRILTERGAAVIKASPRPRKGQGQIQPPFFAHSGHHRMQRVDIDLKAVEGAAIFAVCGGSVVGTDALVRNVYVNQENIETMCNKGIIA